MGSSLLVFKFQVRSWAARDLILPLGSERSTPVWHLLPLTINRDEFRYRRSPLNENQ